MNLDPNGVHDTHVQFPMWELGIEEDEGYVVEELMTEREIPTTGSWFWVRLDPRATRRDLPPQEVGARVTEDRLGEPGFR